MSSPSRIESTQRTEKKKSGLPAAVALCVLVLAACATSEDLRRTRSYFHWKIDKAEEAIRLQKDASSGIISITEERGETVAVLRGIQADLAAEVTAQRYGVHKHTGDLEVLEKELDIAREKDSRGSDEFHRLGKELERLSSGISILGSFFEDIEKGCFLDNGQEKEGPGSKETPQEERDDRLAFAIACRNFKEGKYDDARAGFENFLAQYPDSKYSDNAQFWIGECHYAEERYEMAILAYDKMEGRYPTSEKRPWALLKQGMSFLHLGDENGGRIILRLVSIDYPGTVQARLARMKLLGIK